MARNNSPPVPPLAPSVEEAYRRKCIQLRQRTLEIEESNDAARARIQRIKRQSQKLRLERAFLLEQLAKRTSTNVEDSDGSASPPPMPKDKPLRIKRGHRKPSIIADLEKNSIVANKTAESPATDSQALPAVAAGKSTAPTLRAAGSSGRTLRRPGTAFDMYSADARPAAMAKFKDSDAAVEDELALGWKELPEHERNVYQTRHEEGMIQWQKARDQVLHGKERKAGGGSGSGGGVIGVDVASASADDDNMANDKNHTNGGRPLLPAASATVNDDNDVEMANDETVGNESLAEEKGE